MQWDRQWDIETCQEFMLETALILTFCPEGMSHLKASKKYALRRIVEAYKFGRTASQEKGAIG